MAYKHSRKDNAPPGLEHNTRSRVTAAGRSSPGKKEESDTQESVSMLEIPSSQTAIPPLVGPVTTVTNSSDMIGVHSSPTLPGFRPSSHDDQSTLLTSGESSTAATPFVNDGSSRR